MVKDLETKAYEEWLKNWGLFSVWKEAQVRET